ncbi:MAG TPA: hypothetical protein VLG13_01925, partial [Patescibacteria group bacterium]|nr:hypothetical protein [Patescibacteria group bacterium]
MSVSGKQKAQLLLAIITFGLAVTVLLPISGASAAQITSRSLTLQAGTTDAGAKAGGVVNHFFQFTVPSVGNTNIGSVQFKYCLEASGTCTLPTG